MLLHRTLLIGVIALVCSAAPVLAAEPTAAELENRRCLNCHGQQHIGTLAAKDRAAMVLTTQPVKDPAAQRPSLFVPNTLLASSKHARQACSDCHAEAKTLPHKQEMAAVTCQSGNCHAQQADDYQHGSHSAAALKGNPEAPSCVSCHGTHDIFPKTDRKSHTHPLNIVKICGDCHTKHATPTNNVDGKTHVDNYLDSVHGRAITKGGMAVAATCSDCHHPHKVLPSNDAKSTVARMNVGQTCGQCHIKVSDLYTSSAHGTALVKGTDKAPVCSDCHTSHSITRTDTPAFKLDIVAECGTCHDKPIKDSPGGVTLYQSYRESYHGQVTNLGMERAARCSSCHTAHDVRPVSDPQSKMHVNNRLEACRECHETAGASFASYQAHADPTSFARSPALFGVRWYFIVMMSGAFGFFGLHSVLWFARNVYDRVRHGPHKKHHGGPSIRRFTRVDRLNHGFVIISFFGLTITGLPLLYADEAWGRNLVALLGGPEQAGVLHRMFAIMLGLNFVVHGFGILQRVREHGWKKIFLGPCTMMPRWKDLQDCIGMWKWFFVGGKKPKFDRWTYWEKFDYMAEVGGSAIIGLTGLILWFPEFFSKLLPESWGWVFNVAQYIHGYEALLAIGFIFTIHFFNAHLRLEKFPVDDVMFTGSLPEEEFKEERGEEYDRLLASGELEKLRVEAPRKSYRVIAVVAGAVAMLIGTTLVVLIILAGLNWL